MEHKPREITHQMKPNYFQYELVIHTCNFWAHQEQMSMDDGDALNLSEEIWDLQTIF